MATMPSDRLHVVEVLGTDVVGPVKPTKRMSERAFRDAVDETPHYVYVPAHLHRHTREERGPMRAKVRGAVCAAIMARSYDALVTIWPCDERPPAGAPAEAGRGLTR